MRWLRPSSEAEMVALFLRTELPAARFREALRALLQRNGLPERVITVHADRDQARWDPPGAVVFAGASGDCGHAADRTCGHINFFTSAQAARTWAHANPTVTGTVLRQAQALRRGVAEFGAFMQTGDRTARP